MKKLILTIILAFIIISISCIKKNNDPGCNVKGTWMGRWSASTQEGTWVCNADNNGTDLTGYVYILFDMPSLENHGVRFNGLLLEKQVSSQINISGVKINVNGNVDSESSASGSFSTTIGLSGSWQGVMLPALDFTVIDSIALNIENPYYLGLACDTYRKHIFVGNAGVVNEYNYSFNPIRSFGVDYTGHFCFDGKYLWYSDMSKNKIAKVDTLGNTILDFTSPSNYYDAIMYNEGNLVFSSNYFRKIYTLTTSGSQLSSHDFNYTYITGICKYHDGYLTISNSTPGTIFEINNEGVPVKAFKFSNGYCYGLATDGVNIWCAIERYISTSTNPPSAPTFDVKLFKIRIN